VAQQKESLFTRRFDRLVYLALIVLGGAFVFAAGFSLWALWPTRQVAGYQPEQPTPLPHDIMAGDVKIPCFYCHPTAKTGPVAGMPTVEVCLNCHRFIQPRDERGRLRPMIASFLEKYVDPFSGEPTGPIFWEKVYDVSDFAYFDHSRHTVGARLECQECHGPVERMRVVEQFYPLKMGWCIDCHRKPPEEWRTDGRQTRGPLTCSTCHR
jgi:hypothetical protein